MYVPEGVPGILVQPAWGSFPWNRGEEEEEEGLFKADAVNEEDPERDRATQEEEEEEEEFIRIHRIL